MDASLSSSRSAHDKSSSMSSFHEAVVKIHLTPRTDASTRGCSKSYLLQLTPGIPGIIGRASRSGKLQEESPARAFIDSPVVSRNHSSIIVLRKDEGKPTPYISDIKSMHGTYLNGNKLEPFEETKMTDGDTVSFGAMVNRGEETFHPPHFLVKVEQAEKHVLSNSTYGVPECTSSEVDLDELDELDDEPVITKAANGTRKNPFEVPDETVDPQVIAPPTKPIIKIPDSLPAEEANNETSSLANKVVESRSTKDSSHLRPLIPGTQSRGFSSEDLGDSDYDENSVDDAELREANDESLAVRIEDRFNSDDDNKSVEGYDSDAQPSSHYSEPDSDIDRASIDYPEQEESIPESVRSFSSDEESQEALEQEDLNGESSDSDLDSLQLEQDSDLSDGVDDDEEQAMPISIKETLTSGSPFTSHPIVPTTSEFLASRGPSISNMAKGKEVEKMDPSCMAEFGSIYPFSTPFWSGYEWPHAANPSQPYTQGPFIGGGSAMQPSSFDDYITFGPRDSRLPEYVPPTNAATSHLDNLIERHRSKFEPDASSKLPIGQMNSGNQDSAESTKYSCQVSASVGSSHSAAPESTGQAIPLPPRQPIEASPSANQKAKGISIQDIVHAAPPVSEPTTSCDLSEPQVCSSDLTSTRGTKRKADELEEEEEEAEIAPPVLPVDTTQMVSEPTMTAKPSLSHPAETTQETAQPTSSAQAGRPSKKARTLKYAAGFLAGAVATFAALVIPPEGYYD